MINMMPGLLGKSKTSVSYCNINKNIEQIFYAIDEYEKLDKRVLIYKFQELIITYMEQMMKYQIYRCISKY